MIGAGNGDGRTQLRLLGSSLTALVVGLLALLALTLPATAEAKKPPAFLPITHRYLDLPEGVQPWLPVWTRDGKTVVFRDQEGSGIWAAPKNGKGVQCITCAFADQPAIIGGGGFTYPFPDGERLFIASKELGALGGSDAPASADAYVLECAPSILDCATHSYVPVDMSADKGASFIVQRRTWHLSPDGEHLGWMDIRLDGTAMIVSGLERQASAYVATDPRVVNPAGPTGLSDTSADRWENASQLYELKSFADGGRSILVVGERSSNTDVLKIDLATGKTTRLTGNLDWDEDGAEAPDGDSQVVASWRTRNRLVATAWIPELRDFTGLQLGAAFAPFYVSTQAGFQCDLSPWLLPKGGDAGGKLIGQPLDTYSGNLTAANNLAGLDIWSPDSTQVLLQEKLRTTPPESSNADVAQKGLVPNRIAIAKIHRRGTKPDPTVPTSVGAWAPPATSFAGTLSSDRTATVQGEDGGTATIVYSGTLSKGMTTVTFNRYTDDGKTFVDGTMSTGNPDVTGIWELDAAIQVSGANTGSLDVDLTVNNDTKPLPTKSGSWNAVYNGKTAPPLPEVGECYSKLPKDDKLQLKAKSLGDGELTVRVRADIAGDRRPVEGATVKVGGATVKTDSRGRATLKVKGRGRRSVTATAGDTFKRARAKVRVG